MDQIELDEQIGFREPSFFSNPVKFVRNWHPYYLDFLKNGDNTLIVVGLLLLVIIYMLARSERKDKLFRDKEKQLQHFINHIEKPEPTSNPVHETAVAVYPQKQVEKQLLEILEMANGYQISIAKEDGVKRVF